MLNLIRTAIQTLIGTPEAEVRQLALDYLFKLQEQLQASEIAKEVTANIEKRDWFHFVPEAWRGTVKSVITTIAGLGLFGTGYGTSVVTTQPAVVVNEESSKELTELKAAIATMSESVDKVAKQRFKLVGRDKDGNIRHETEF